MKKILIVMTSLSNGGAERSLVNFLTEFPKDRYEIDLLLFKKEGMFLNQVPKNINILETPRELKAMYGNARDAGIKFPLKLISNFISKIFTKNSREMRGFRWKNFYTKNIKKYPKHYDTALAYISGEVLYYVDEKVDADKKIVWIHNDYRSAKHPRKYDYSHLKNMNEIVTISDSCVDILKEEFPEFKDKIIMIENINSSVVLNNRANEFFPNEFEKDGINIVSIGRLNEQKGFDLAINAAAIIKKHEINFKWFIIGIGALKNQLEKQIQENNLEKNVFLVGAKDNPYPYIKNCTLLVQSSRYEGKSVVLDEAKILKIPIVVTSYPTVYDQIIDKKEGLIVPINPEGIAKGIEEILNNDSIKNELISYLARHEYGNQKEIKKYCDLLD